MSALADSGCCVLVNVFQPTDTDMPAAVPQRVIAIVVSGLFGDADRYQSDISEFVFMPPSCVRARIAALVCLMQNPCNAKKVADCGGVRALNLAVRCCCNNPEFAAQGCVALTRLAQCDASRNSFIEERCVNTVIGVIGQHGAGALVQARALALLLILVESRRMQLEFRKSRGAPVLKASLAETLWTTGVVRGILRACSR